MHQNKYKIFSLALLISFMSFYCGEPIPVEDMGNAKYEITRAENVKADTYAKETIEAARAALFESHDLVSKSKLKEAKEKAIEAGNLAKEAYSKAVPELAKETKKEAEQMIAEADRAYAEELAPEPYGNAKQLLASGDENMTGEKYYEAFQSFENAREEAIKARNHAEAQAETIEREVIAVEDLIKEAIEYGANESTPDKIAEAEGGVKRAHEYLDNKYLKDAHNETVKARANAEEASRTAQSNYAAKKKLEANGAVSDAEKEMVNLKAELEKDGLKKALSKSDEAQESLKNAEETLTAAQEALNNSGSALESDNYKTSIEHSNEAIRLSKLVKDQIPALLVLIKQADERELALSSKGETATETGTTQTTTETATKEKDSLAEGWKVYTVRLIPERRDCLWRIAEYKNIYADPFKWTRIYKANKHQIKNPDLIYPGQVFDIPPATGDIVKPAKQAPVAPALEEKKEGVEGVYNEKALDRPRMEDGKNSENSDSNTQTPVDTAN